MAACVLCDEELGAASDRQTICSECWVRGYRLLLRTTAKLETEWDRGAPPGERVEDGWCWSEAEAARDYLEDHRDRYEALLEASGWRP